MIRFFAAALILAHLSFALVGCTSSPSSDDEFSSAQPIEDEGDGAVSDAGDQSGGDDEFADSSDAPADDLGGDDLDADSSGGGDEQAVASDDSADSGDDDLDLDAEFEKEAAGDEAAPDDSAVAQNDVPGEDQLEDEISDGDLQDEPVAKEQPVESAPAPVPPAEPEQAEKARVRDIRYLANSSGGTVVIETSKPITYQSRLNPATQQFVIEMSGVELPASLQRPYLTNDFNSRIGSINAYQAAGSDTARVVIQLNGKSDNEPVVQQEGTSLVVIPPAPTAVAQQPTTPAAPAAPGKAGTTSTKGMPLSARTLDEFLTGNQKFFGRKISLQVKDADVRDVVNFLAEDSGANVVMSDDVKGHISLKLRRVPWDQALVTVMRTKELGYVRQGNVLRISTLKELQGEAEAATKILAAQKAIVPAIVQVIPVNYASMDDLVKNLTPFLTKDTGKIVADNRTNTLIVTDKAEVVDRVEKLVKTLDVPPAQVSIESKIVEAVEEFESFMGISWGFSGADVPLSTTGGAQGAPINLNLGAQSASFSRDFTGAGPLSATLGIGTLDMFGDLTATLMLAERDALAKVISAPRISSMNREKSTIQQKGENVSVITTKSEQTGAVTKTEKRTPFSLELSVTPQITADGSVIMDLDVKREFLGAVVDAETGAAPVNTRSAKTKVLVHNGQTAVIGGIYTSDELASTNGVPGLMNIPILGWLFKNKSTKRSKNELLIFLTPRIIAQQDISSEQTASAQ